ncbi:hypothetical protein [Acidovorax sp. M2(2025)]|uniref:hypothetical protein n=1 Tax=Acidovorax sp. M2(2025) TaxID=3411355 RepID=UPI003BF4D2C4
MRSYTRQAKLKPDQWGNGLSGALQLLFSTENGHALRTSFEKRILRKFHYSLEGRKRQKKDLVFWFLAEDKKLFPNYQEHWPS